jgi:ATP-binding cassette subfamily G (WHITE) protein 2
LFCLKGTIIFSIHQPRYSIFKLFDTIFLVAAGHCVYHGPSRDVLPYFASIGFQCEEHDNPADFLLDVSQGDYQPSLPSTDVYDGTDPDKQHDKHVDYLRNAYAKSTMFTEIKRQITGLDSSRNSATTSTANKAKLPRKSRVTEILYVAQRTFRNAFRNPALIGMQIGVSIFLGVLIGLIYLKTDHSTGTGIKNRLGVIFFMVTNQVFGSLSALDLFIKERPLFKHENVSGYYHVSTYFIAKLICDILLLRTIPSILFSGIAYFMIGFQRTAAKFFIFFFGIYATSLCASSLCFFVSASVQVFGKRFISLKSSLFLLFHTFRYCQFSCSHVLRFNTNFQWISGGNYICCLVSLVDKMDQHFSILI